MSSNEKLEDFVKKRAKGILRVLEARDADPAIITAIKKHPGKIIEHKDYIYKLMKDVNDIEKYPLTKAHLEYARIDLLKNPTKASLKGLDDFLTQELSEEPQVGVIIGAAYSPQMGIGFLVPINTQMLYKIKDEDIIVTGIAKTSAMAQVDHAAMTIQSAKEALSLSINYFQMLLGEQETLKDLSVSGIVGKLLENRTIHHQMESVNYMGGGPSAGFALAINTLSTILQIPVFNDFGITGAPRIKGTSKSKAGSSVIIGGADKKSERVLTDLRRMYVPAMDYYGVPPDMQENFWNEGKIVIPVRDFRDILPEVMYFNDEHGAKVDKLIEDRVALHIKAKECHEDDLQEDIVNIQGLEAEIKEYAEFEVMKRIVSLNNYFRDSQRDELLSVGQIFHKYCPTCSL